MIKPRKSHNGDSLVVEEGTKGGRSRVVSITTDEQRRVLESAEEMSLKGSRGTLIRAGLTPSQARRRLYYVCERLGITKSQLAITPHGLRHQYANDRYEQVAGVPTVVRGASQILKGPRDRAAREAVTKDLGHARISITTAYTGSRRSILIPRVSAGPQLA